MPAKTRYCSKVLDEKMYLIDPMSGVELLIFLLFMICNFVFRNQVSICKFLGHRNILEQNGLGVKLTPL